MFLALVLAVGLQSAAVSSTTHRHFLLLPLRNLCALVALCSAETQQQQQNGTSSSSKSSEAVEQLVAASGKLSLLDRMMHKLVAGGHR